MPFKDRVERILARLEQVLQNPIECVNLYKSEQRTRVVGWLLTDVPEELIHAAGALPFGITGSIGGFTWADAHLQTWACSLMRGCLEIALQGKLSCLDGLIIPHTCDTTRNLSGIWKQARPLPWMENFLMPRQVDRPSAKPYLIGEFGRLKAKLEHCTGNEITVPRLKESIMLYNQNRLFLRSLFQYHVKNPGILGNRAIYNIIKSSMVMPKEEHNRLLIDLTEVLPPEPEERASRLRLVLSGKVWEPPEIMDILDEEQVVVIADDFATGHRYITADVPETGDPIEALADRQINRMPFACYNTIRYDRRNFLVNLVREKANGLIFVHFKYCEPENFDYPDMRSALETAGIQTLRIETEVGNVSLGQMRTRLQAYLEMLRGGN
ncbi:hypothetical protein SY88_02925 [Clostridiales bacterium PH28_bin88]|nr:hypothetical protein SY88_02925 [Clostridiales bacterium PH28_bin88]